MSVQADDALSATGMNVNPGGKQSTLMRDAVYERDGVKVTQRMTFQDGDKLLFNFRLNVDVTAACTAGVIDEAAALAAISAHEKKEKTAAEKAAAKAAAAPAVERAPKKPRARQRSSAAAGARDAPPATAPTATPAFVAVQFNEGEVVGSSSRLKVGSVCSLGMFNSACARHVMC